MGNVKDFLDLPIFIDTVIRGRMQNYQKCGPLVGPFRTKRQKFARKFVLLFITGRRSPPPFLYVLRRQVEII